MKNIFKTSKVFIFLLIIILLGCQKDYLNVNTDPNNPANSTVQLTFPAGVGSTAYVLGGYYQLLGGFWAQHWTQSVGASQWRTIDAYNLTSSDFDTRQWGELYSGALNDYKYVRDQSKATQNWSYYLMATIMQAYTYQVLADLYDQIPFSDALNGLNGNLTPKFDNGQQVYDGLITMINEALTHDYKTFKSQTNPNATSIQPGTDDIIFQGDMSKWEKFANTLKLKIYLRQCYARPTVAQAGIQSLYTNNAPFLDVDAKIMIFTNAQNKRNPAYETFVDMLGGNIATSYTIYSYLNNSSDPRLPALINKRQLSPQQYFCIAQGDYFNVALGGSANIQNLSTPVLAPLDPVYFISAAESYFLQAEAIERYTLTGDAKTLYQTGIDASFTRLGVTGSATLYATGGPYEYPSTTFENKLEQIIIQKWVAMTNNQGLEAFLEQSRTHYPKVSTLPADSSNYIPGQFTISVNSAIGNFFPKRLLFPDSERRRNPNTPTLQPIYIKVWWDTKP